MQMILALKPHFEEQGSWPVSFRIWSVNCLLMVCRVVGTDTESEHLGIYIAIRHVATCRLQHPTVWSVNLYFAFLNFVFVVISFCGF